MNKISKEQIEGILLCLNKIKVNKSIAFYIIAETNDLDGLDGFFELDQETWLIEFKPNK